MAVRPWKKEAWVLARPTQHCRLCVSEGTVCAHVYAHSGLLHGCIPCARVTRRLHALQQAALFRREGRRQSAHHRRGTGRSGRGSSTGWRKQQQEYEKQQQPQQAQQLLQQPWVRQEVYFAGSIHSSMFVRGDCMLSRRSRTAGDTADGSAQVVKSSSHMDEASMGAAITLLCTCVCVG